ncbi:MAG: hypothetical protein LUD68_01400 [Rikenellaceae bacterium]|nr:hypothetical protein [Rikenellaceae bacterium]
MINEIIGWVSNDARKIVSRQPEISEERQEKTVKVATLSFLEGLQQYLREDNLSALGSLIDERQAGLSDEGASEMLQGIQEILVVSLISRAALSPVVAENIAVSLIPAVLTDWSVRLNDSGRVWDLRALAAGLTEVGSAGLSDRVEHEFKRNEAHALNC